MAPVSPKSASGLVLMVEDPFVCTYVRSVLVRRGYEFVEADAEGALQVLARREPPVCVLITNQPEPFLEYSDHVPVLYMASFPDLSLASRFRACRPLAKPFRSEQLVDAVEHLAGSI